MSNPWLFLLLVIAIGVGWLIGRYSRPRRMTSAEARFARRLPKSDYFRGLNYLINEEPDGAIDAFVAALEVNDETLETHIALGNLLRRRGEVDRATRVHQNLLACSNLLESQRQQAHLELARDFMAAGLLDRAEHLLVELVGTSIEYKTTGLKHLVEIYRDEREWHKAIQAALQLHSHSNNKLLPIAKKNLDFKVPLSHFCCEIAELAMLSEDYREVRQQIKQALHYDKDCARANLILSKLEYAQGRYRQALQALGRIPVQNPEFIPESVELALEYYPKLEDKKVLQEYLDNCITARRDISLLLPITAKFAEHQNEIVSRCSLGNQANDVKVDVGYERASNANILADQLKKQPTLRGLSHFLEISSSHEKGADILNLVKEMIDKLAQTYPKYRCKRCGFSGSQLHWLCPSCKQWASICSVEG